MQNNKKLKRKIIFADAHITQQKKLYFKILEFEKIKK